MQTAVRDRDTRLAEGIAETHAFSPQSTRKDVESKGSCSRQEVVLLVQGSLVAAQSKRPWETGESR